MVQKMKVMQIGYGYWGTNVAKKLMISPKFDFRYLVEKDAGRRDAARAELSDTVEILEDYEEKLAEVEAVVICTQTQYSYDIALKAMQAGKHIFIEKPIASTVEKTQNLIQCAKERGIILHCDHLMVYNPVIRYIKRMIDTGEMGEIMYIDISRVNLGPIRKDINAMLDLAVHDIAVIDYLLGSLEPEQLNAYGTKFYGNQETITYLTMKCGETLININSSWISPVKVRRTLIAGTKKMVIFDDVKMDKLYIYDSGIDVKQGEVYGEYEFQTRVGDMFVPHIKFEDSLQNSLEHFADCIAENKESLSGPKQSLRVMKVLERAQKALQE